MSEDYQDEGGSYDGKFGPVAPGDAAPTVRELAPITHRSKHAPFRGRITVNGFIQHQPAKSQPATMYQRFDRRCASDEFPYFRPPMTIGEEWRALDLGHLGADANPPGPGVGLIMIYNAAPDYEVVPTAEERAVAEAAVIQVAVNGVPFARVRPGEASFRIEPEPDAVYTVRCLAGKTKITTAAFPI